jgi:2-hydroxy-6-oxonona-2,4-dienedioate hydrolase
MRARAVYRLDPGQTGRRGLPQHDRVTYRAALLYFLAVFGAGFVLGVVRVLWLARELGERVAELLEIPVMLAVMLAAARLTVRRLALPATLGARLGMGLGALLMLLAAEFSMVLWLRGISLRTYFINLDPVSAAAYYGALVIFAALPVWMPPAIAGRWRAAAVDGAALLAVAGLVVYGSYRYDVGVERERVASGSSIAQTRCGAIEYAALGAGPAVLLVHGAGGGFDQMLPLAQDLAGAGFRVVAVSRFGYLRTPLPPDASPQAQADAHACLLDKLGIERAGIIGVSAGAPSSMQFALRHPGRTTALVLMVPLTFAPREPEEMPAYARFMLESAVRSDFLYWAAMTAYPDAVIRTVLGTPPALLASADIEERLRVRQMMRQILPVGLRAQGLINEAKVAASLARYDLERISAPTLAISAEDDGYGTYVAARYTAQHVPNARFVGYRTGGHMLVGHTAEVSGRISSFLGGASAPGGAR